MKTYDERSRDIRSKIAQKKRRRKTITTVVSLSCCLVSIVGIMLIPHSEQGTNDTIGHVTSAYSTLIRELERLTDPKRNETIYDGLVMETPEMEDPDMEPPGDPTEGIGGSGSYEEITDDQVQGVTEADLIKRSDSHIYYLRGDTLTVYSIEGGSSRQVGSYTIAADEGASYRVYTNELEMYLSQDCKTVTILTACYDDTQEEKYLYVLSLDVSDPSSIRRAGHTFISGSYKDSRLIGEDLYLFSHFYVDYGADLLDKRAFLPGYGTPESMTYLPMDDIFIPEDPSSAMYTVVSKLDASTLEMEDTLALLSYTGTVYMSQQNIYLTRSYQESATDGDRITMSAMTEISQISYDENGLKNEGAFAVAGSVKDQYSLDEYDGILRVATTIDRSIGIQETYEDRSYTVSLDASTNASLYCIDLYDHSIRASVECFAPEGESVRSVRFKADQAYVCTSIVLSDPVFFFDMSDLDHITCKDTGTIDGYSMSLIDFADGFLMGIGYGSRFDTLKIEIYREDAATVVSHCAYELPNCWFSTDYKSYYIDRENRSIGLGVDQYGRGSRYILLHFDGYELVELLDVALDGSPVTMRAVYIDGYLYMFGDSFLVEKVL